MPGRELKQMAGNGPLAGIQVIELAGLGPAPFCGMMLGDLGAEIIRIDRAGQAPWGIGDILGRGRKSIAVDLKKPGAAAIVLRLVADADAFIEGFRPGVAERLGLGPEECLAVNPRLAYGRMTGWGQTGPLAQAPGHDINYLALSGMLWPIGNADRPPPPPLNLVGDFGGGGMMLALGLLAAILHARTTGKGQIVDAAMTDGAATLGTMIFGMMAQNSWKVEREANFIDGAAPFYTTYACSDGGFVSVGAMEPQFYRSLLSLLDLSDPRFDDQWNRSMWPALREALETKFRERSRDAWCRLLEGSDACFAPVLSPREAFDHPHNIARGTFVSTRDGRLPRPAPRFSATDTRLGDETGPAGCDTLAILRRAGFREEEIARAIDEGIVATGS
jgi:alpha-methylacyl-CoA racemase